MPSAAQWVPSNLHPQALPPDQPTVQTASGSVRELHSTNLGAAGQFFVATQGAGGGGVARAMAAHTVTL